VERIAHNLVQGSPEWHAFRLEHCTASEASAMLGISKLTKRTELLRMKSTGDAKEFCDWVQKNILDHGHEVEAKARPILEEMIGSALYPATYSYGPLSASCDGLTMDGETAFEHKQPNAELTESVKNNILPDEHQPQCQQVIMVTGAKKVIFVVSDGTADNFESMTVYPDPAWQKRIALGWKQFKEDLSNFKHVEVKPEAVGKAPESLPALHIEVTGMVTASNLAEFKTHSLAVFSRINTDLNTDNDFADAEKTVKWCKEMEDRLEAAKNHALSQTESIDELFKTIDDIKEQARSKRLQLDKLVASRKQSIRSEIMEEGINAVSNHINNLNTRLQKTYMPKLFGDFAGVMKGKKTVASLRDAVDTELANLKIQANQIADKIEINLNYLRENAKDYISLFADTSTIVLKENDDFIALVKIRISDHKQAEKDKADREEQERLDREALEAQEKEAPAQVEPVKAESPVGQAPVTRQSVATEQQAEQPVETFSELSDEDALKVYADNVKDAINDLPELKDKELNKLAIRIQKRLLKAVDDLNEKLPNQSAA